MTLVMVLVAVALLSRWRVVRKILPFESLVVASLVAAALATLFQTGRLG